MRPPAAPKIIAMMVVNTAVSGGKLVVLPTETIYGAAGFSAAGAEVSEVVPGAGDC